MQGLVNFAGDIGYAIAVLLPAFCYLAAIALFLYAGWGFWRQSHPDNPHRGRPWVPMVALILCGVFASFDQFLTKANVSAGTGLQVSLVAGLTEYAPPTVPAGGVLGATPGNTLLNVVQLFQGFFQSFGAMCCFFAVLGWWSTVKGQSNRGAGSCGVQFAFGVMLMNIDTISSWLVTVFQT